MTTQAYVASPTLASAMTSVLAAVVSDLRAPSAQERVSAYYRGLHPRYIEFLENLPIDGLVAADRYALAAATRNSTKEI